MEYNCDLSITPARRARSFATLFNRELRRFLRMPAQTLVPSVLRSYLFVYVLSISVKEMAGNFSDDVLYWSRSMVLVATLYGSYANTAYSLLDARTNGIIRDIAGSPMSCVDVLAAFTLASTVRGLLVGVLSIAAMQFVTDLHVTHWFRLLLSMAFDGLLFAQVGFLVGILVGRSDSIATWTSIIVYPAIWVGGLNTDRLALNSPIRILQAIDPLFLLFQNFHTCFDHVQDNDALGVLLGEAAAIAFMVLVSRYLWLAERMLKPMI